MNAGVKHGVRMWREKGGNNMMGGGVFGSLLCYAMMAAIYDLRLPYLYIAGVFFFPRCPVY